MESEFVELKKTLKIQMLTSFYKSENQIAWVKCQAQGHTNTAKARISVSGVLDSILVCIPITLRVDKKEVVFYFNDLENSHRVRGRMSNHLNSFPYTSLGPIQ